MMDKNSKTTPAINGSIVFIFFRTVQRYNNFLCVFCVNYLVFNTKGTKFLLTITSYLLPITSYLLLPTHPLSEFSPNILQV